MSIKFSRRQFLSLSLLAFLRPAFSTTKPSSGLFINGHLDGKKNYFVSGFNETGQHQFTTPLPEAVHSFAIHPKKKQQLITIPTLPGTRMGVVDTLSGELNTVIECKEGRHFNGHACFSPDGQYLFTNENIYADATGVISIRNGDDFSVIDEISAHGIGPHDLRILPDGRTLVVASGGIKTHPSSGKRELNINHMKSALLLIDAHSGQLKARHEIPVAKLSIRHLHVDNTGRVLVACQYKGKREMPPLVGVQQGDSGIEMLQVDDDTLWEMRNYTASARIAGDMGGVTCPRGNYITLWDLKNKRFLKRIKIKDVGGIEICANGRDFLVSANTGELYRIDTQKQAAIKLEHSWTGAKWTNHMIKT